MNNLYDIIINNINGCTFVSLDTITNVTLRGGAKNPLQGKVQKHTVGANVMIFQNKSGSSYQTKVKKHLLQEGFDPDTFVVQPRKWGNRIKDTPFIEHKGKYYLEVIFLNPGTVFNKVNGQLTPAQDIEGYPPITYPRTQHQLDKKVMIRVFSFESIHKIVINGKRYVRGEDFE